MIDNDTILRFIAAHPGCTCAQIADACRISSRLMATKLRTLSKAGTIQSVKIRDGKNPERLLSATEETRLCRARPLRAAARPPSIRASECWDSKANRL